ncbi:unnamed protein product [Ectocarpus sp. CCAP 1310/34]|nr:unnamed protein product [Ectocarpus sp. CCAP 1310/34]
MIGGNLATFPGFSSDKGVFLRESHLQLCLFLLRNTELCVAKVSTARQPIPSL